MKPISAAVTLAMAFACVGQSTLQSNYVGIGGHVGFAVLDASNGVSEVDAGFAFGVNGDAAFDLGVIGEAHYTPSIGFVIGGDEEGTVDYFAMEIALNLFDGRYYFPLPSTFPVRPYAGFGPMFAIQIGRWERNTRDPLLDAEDTDVDPDFGMNFFAGVDFPVLEKFRLNAEIRGKVGDWDLFKMTLGGVVVLGG